MENLPELQTASPRHAWDRQPNETDYAYSMFQKFLDAGPDASLEFIAELVATKGAEVKAAKLIGF